MKAVPEKDRAGRIVWRVKFSVPQRRVRKTFQTQELANAWIDDNRAIAVDEGRIFGEAWNGITAPERHEVLDVLGLMPAPSPAPNQTGPLLATDLGTGRRRPLRPQPFPRPTLHLRRRRHQLASPYLLKLPHKSLTLIATRRPKRPRPGHQPQVIHHLVARHHQGAVVTVKVREMIGAGSKLTLPS